MAKSNLLDTSTVTLDEILSSGKIYKVPPYQRDYSWSDENWEDLWEDIIELKNNPDTYHYMGSIVVQSNGDKNYFVIDGQQRFTTLSIIILAVIKRIEELIEGGSEPEQNGERVEILRRTYLGDKNPKSLMYSSKLFLNANNDDFYQSYILQLRAPNSKRALIDSNKKLLRAFDYFYSKIPSIGEDLSTGEGLASFLMDVIARQLLFIQISVEDELSAYIVFETLNARGVELTSTDLLKNYLFSLVDEETDLPHVQRQWKRISDIVGVEKFPEFLRYFMNSQKPIVRTERLFKTIKSNVRTAKEGVDLLDDLEIFAEVYGALRNPDNELWRGNKQARSYVRQLRLFNVKQVYPLLLSAYRSFGEEDFTKVLKLAVIISFRYSVICGFNPNELEKAYNRAAVKIFEEEITKPRDVFNQLNGVYVDDDQFEDYFSFKSINSNRRKKLVRYILYSIETHLTGVERDFEFDTGTIEHILPENPSEDWSVCINEELQPSYIYRLGNYTLLERGINNDLSNDAYDEKKAGYEKSQYALSRESMGDGWSEEAINDRQKSLAKCALHIWRSDYAG